MYSENDLQFMRLALEQARKALFISNPNPRVGCVIVNEGQIIGIGHTQEVGGPHAEIAALNDAKSKGHSIQGATAYVTLEPCCHHGKTPPCTDALIGSGIKMVIAAMEDPNPLVAGQGFAALKHAGIETRCGLFEKEARELNPGFIKRMQTGLPWVRMKIAASLDGVTALENGQSQWITGEDARLDGHRWRAQACAILTGVGTLIHDNPQLTVRGIDTPRQPLRVLVDSKLEVPLDSKILQGGNTIVFCANPEPSHLERMHKELHNRNVALVQLPNPHGKVDLPGMMRYLAEHIHINEVHIEAGHQLNGSLLNEGCIDELLLYLAPCFLGSGKGLVRLKPIEDLSKRFEWQPFEQELIGNDLRLRYLAIPKAANS